MTERGGTDNSINDTTVHGTAFQARDVGQLVINHYATPAPPTAAPTEALHPWVREIDGSQLWQRVPETQNRFSETRDGEAFRGAARVLAGALGALHDEAERTFADDDPWWDRGLTKRFHGHISRLARAGAWQLAGVEALLLALAPFLSQCLWARTAAARRHVGPSNLEPTGTAGERADFEVFFHREHERLVRRARLGLPARGDAKKEIGWWLFHQWVDAELRGAERYSCAYKDLMDRLPWDDPALVAVSADRVLRRWRLVERMLYGVRLPPGELCRPERLETVDAVASPGGGGQVRQVIHARRLGLLLAVARARALDMPALPDVLVENLGIPHRVDLDELRTTLDEADWEGDTATTVLAAECHHEAVFEALLQHTNQIDALLSDIHRTVRDSDDREPLRALPIRAQAERLKPAQGDDLRPKFESYSKFQVDPQRVQTLLMGDQLYRSPGLAVRELYQNALDACRYRRARTAYQTRLARKKGVVRGDSWTGKIRFRQGVENGRAYLECEDNGIGMSDSDLARVFARAGTRFTDLTDVRNERAKWHTEDVHLYPVSRFGIGVLSYFMIADEIEVTTRKLREDGSTGPCYTTSIHGPNHLFRIAPTETGRTGPGTTVRLYVRDNAPSCVRELTRLLGVADFETTAEFEGRGPAVTWEAGELRPRPRSSWDDGTDGIHAEGALVPCLRTADAAIPQVVWCGEGGGVLVDGLLARPSRPVGLLAVPRRDMHTSWQSSSDGRLRGAVVNLVGAQVPKLSIDRLEILEDVSGKTGELLGAAAEELVASDPDLLTFGWITDVARHSPGVADIVVRAAMVAGVELGLRDGRTFKVAEVGCFPTDTHLIALALGNTHPSAGTPDHVLLWRLLHHGAAEAFSVLVPELRDVGPLLPALPSDHDVLGGFRDWTGVGGDVAPGHVLSVASWTGMTPRTVAQRAVALGADINRVDPFPDTPPDPLDLALLSRSLNGSPDWLPADEPVPLGHFLDACLRLDISVPEAARRLKGYGLDVTAATKLPARPGEEELRLLSVAVDDVGGWLPSDEPVPPGRVLQQSVHLGVSAEELRQRLRDFGLTVGQAPAVPGPSDMRLLSHDLDGARPWLVAGESVPGLHLLWAARELDLSMNTLVSILESYGMAVPSVPTWEPSARDWALFDVYESAANCDYLWIWADELNLTLKEVADGLRRLGVDIVFDPPEAPDTLDTVLLNERLKIWSDRGLNDSSVSIVELLTTAQDLRRSTAEIASRLASYGLDIPDYDHPDRNRCQDDLKLLSCFLHGVEPWLDPRECPHLGHIYAASRKLDLTMDEVAARLRYLGVDVPDVRDMIRAAMAKLPRLSGDGRSREQNPDQVREQNPD
ncbi:wHTH domain-containing protein [Streptomyces sp. NPDC002643]